MADVSGMWGMRVLGMCAIAAFLLAGAQSGVAKFHDYTLLWFLAACGAGFVGMAICAFVTGGLFSVVEKPAADDGK